jgi:hypothetical protein
MIDGCCRNCQHFAGHYLVCEAENEDKQPVAYARVPSDACGAYCERFHKSCIFFLPFNIITDWVLN